MHTLVGVALLVVEVGLAVLAGLFAARLPGPLGGWWLLPFFAVAGLAAGLAQLWTLGPRGSPWWHAVAWFLLVGAVAALASRRLATGQR